MKKILFLLSCVFAIAASAQMKYPDSWTDGKYITVNGAKLWVVTVGKGDPLILISGGPGGTHVGLRRFDSLAANYQLIYFDAFGRGKSDTAKDVKEYTIERDIEDIEGLRTALHLDKINVLGHSYGGVVAQGYAIKYAAHVKHLVLANTFHSFIMWQANDDNSNHEIKTNYPEVWDSLMRIRERDIYQAINCTRIFMARFLMVFCMATIPIISDHGGSKPYPNSFNSKALLSNGGKGW